MDLGFDLTDEQQMISESIRGFAAERLAPGAAERDRTHRYPDAEVREMAQMGLLSLKVPEEHGGGGAGSVSYVLAMVAVAEACASCAVIMASSNLSSKILSEFGSDAHVDRYLKPLSEGKLGPMSFALSEPEAGSNAAALKTTATKDGDGWLLNGSKQWITNGSNAGVHIVFARTSDDPKGGITCFVVEKGTEGLEVGAEERKMGLRSSGTVPLHFEDCRIPDENRVGEVGQGYRIAMSALAGGRIGIAAQCIGIAEAAMKEGIGYAMERRAFGERVVDFQNSQFQIADSRMELDAAWLLAMRAARCFDAGSKAAVESSMAKLYASEACWRIVDRMLQLHGGYGYVEDYAIERLYRDARVPRIYEGTSEIQRVVMSRKIIEGFAG
jgi:alkylation response protein AidB-like acyl-CoA dehydrogenase